MRHQDEYDAAHRRTAKLQLPGESLPAGGRS